MKDMAQELQPDELIAAGLRGLFHQRGFQRVNLEKFEEYSLYIDNLNFLNTDSLITFMDFDGRLLALKPDTTLSIVKNVSPKIHRHYEKLYYMDEVYRLSRENREYRVVHQVGVELLGDIDGFACLEVVDLAVESLRRMGHPYVLVLSHLGFLAGLLTEAGLSYEDREAVYNSLVSKNAHDAAAILREQGAPDSLVDRVTATAGLRGKLREVLPQARELACNREMESAMEELSALAANLGDAGKFVHLDFSVVNSQDYYNGIIFHGYLEGMPKMVLSGGRYDNLMKKMNKQGGAIGFAVELDGLGTYLGNSKGADFDLLITYSDSADHGALLSRVWELCGRGLRVRVEREDFDPRRADFTYERRVSFGDGEPGEVPEC